MVSDVVAKYNCMACGSSTANDGAKVGGGVRACVVGVGVGCCWLTAGIKAVMGRKMTAMPRIMFFMRLADMRSESRMLLLIWRRSSRGQRQEVCDVWAREASGYVATRPAYDTCTVTSWTAQLIKGSAYNGSVTLRSKNQAVPPVLMVNISGLATMSRNAQKKQIKKGS